MTDEMTSLGERIVAAVLDSGIAEREEIEGCSEREITRVESTCGVVLPSGYKSFLRHLGRSSGDFLRGYTCHYPKILVVQSKVERKFGEDGVNPTFGESEYVFAGSQDVTFYYFDTQNPYPDPPVHVFAEGYGDPEKHAESLSDWLLDHVEKQSNSSLDDFLEM